jgi:nifR3 family TIM-barrel protein
MSFWKSFGSGIYTLAPMEDVTDTVFREVVLSASTPGKLHVVYTEFCSTDGLCHPVGQKKVSHRFLVNPSERELLKEKGVNLVAQIWGSRPEKFAEAVKFLMGEFEFDGIDINMGCPVKKIVKQGGCSALIGKPELAKEIFMATRESTSLPVSVKTRTGLKKHNTAEWIGEVLSWKPDAVILHCRTQTDQSERPADWDQMNIAIETRNSIAPEIPMLGNGDIFSMADAARFMEQTGAEGVMFGRGIFHNPWLFNEGVLEKSPEEKMDLLLKHTRLFVDTWGRTKNFNILKRFFKIYISGFENSAKLKAELMNTNTLEEVQTIICKS